MNKNAKKFIIFIFILLLSIELLARIKFCYTTKSIGAMYYGLNLSKIAEYTPNFPEKLTVNKNNKAIRDEGRMIYPDKFNIAYLGGSTTRGTFVNYTESWPYYLERLLNNDKINVFNYGLDGADSYDDYRRMQVIVNTI